MLGGMSDAGEGLMLGEGLVLGEECLMLGGMSDAVGRSDDGGQPAPRCTQSCDYKSL